MTEAAAAPLQTRARCPGHRDPDLAPGHVREGRRRIREPVGDPVPGRRVVIALAPALPQFTEAGRQAALDMQVKQTGAVRTAAGHARAVQPAWSRSSQLQRGTSAIGRHVHRPADHSLLFAGALLGGLQRASSAAPPRSSRCWRRHASQVIAALGASIGAPIQLHAGHDHDGRPVQPRRARPIPRRQLVAPNVLGSISVFTHLGRRSSTAIGWACSTAARPATSRSRSSSSTSSSSAASSSMFSSRSRALDNRMTRKKKVFIGLGRRRRAGRAGVRQPRAQAHDRRRGHRREDRDARSRGDRLGQRQDPAEGIGRHQRRDDGQGRQRRGRRRRHGQEGPAAAADRPAQPRDRGAEPRSEPGVGASRSSIRRSRRSRTRRSRCSESEDTLRRQEQMFKSRPAAARDVRARARTTSRGSGRTSS